MIKWKYDKREARRLGTAYSRAVLEQIEAQTELQKYSAQRDMTVNQQQYDRNIGILQRRVKIKGEKVLDAYKAMATCVGFNLGEQQPAEPSVPESLIGGEGDDESTD